MTPYGTPRLSAGGDSLVAQPRVCRSRSEYVSRGTRPAVTCTLVLERPQSVPDAPGSYQFRDETGRIIYVGKALSLRSRLSSYFQDPVHLHPRTAQMVERATSVEWIVVASDVEAIMLEYNLIKTHRPRFNIRLVDDKSYPYLAVTVGDEWPKATVMRGAKRKDTRYFGPYAHAYAIRETLDLLLRSFPVRTCSDAKFRRHQLLGRPCLLYHIERCSGPCVGAIGPEEYGMLVAELMEFLDGDTKPVVDRLEAEMRLAAGELEFERAARLRDRLATVRLAVERQQMVTDTPEDLDAVAIAEDELAAAVQVFHVRRGRVVGRHGFIVEKVEPLTTPQLIGRVLEQHYAETPIGIPRDLLVPESPEDVATYEAWLSGLRGGRVTVRVPMRGRKTRAVGNCSPERGGAAEASPAATGQRPHEPRGCDRGVAARPRVERSTASHRVLRHEPHAGHRLRGLDGGARGWAAEAKRLPEVQGDGRPRKRRLRRHARGAHSAPSAAQ